MPRGDAFASREPYFTVLADERFLLANFDAAAEKEFFQSGENHVHELLGVVATTAPHFHPSTVLEYGCGVGRLAIPLARRAEFVTAVDSSPSMLDRARAHGSQAGVANIEFVAPDSLEPSRTFDLVNCFLVLQRLRTGEGLELLRQLAGRVREGGIAVFQLPYRSTAPAALRISRAIRSRVPLVNAAANVVRHKPAATPMIASHTYDLNEVMTILSEQGFDSPRVILRSDGDLESAVIYALKRSRPGFTAPAAALEAPAVDPTLIDVKQLIANTSIEELNVLAEKYFSSLDNWEHHLAKPFARAEDTPQLLISVGALLQGLQLESGMTVLEYGAGTGWLSRFLTQLGCRMILLDVAPTALEIAKELYERQPAIGDRPAPQFLQFDGRRISLEDASVDRVLCFDSFHHAVNPADILREFARVLKPGGIAGFIEPGPEHSRSPQSQYEMRTYGVIENDIDIHTIWSDAQSVGFTDLRLAAFNVPPFHVSLPEYDDLLAGGQKFGEWAEATRRFLRNVRTFFLSKGAAEHRDSRRPEGLSSAIAAELAQKPTASSGGVVRATVTNTGRTPWLPSEVRVGGVSLGCHLYDAAGRLLQLDFAWQKLPKGLDSGESLEVTIELPPLAPGRYVVELDCVANEVAWFAQLGSPVSRITLEVE